MKLRIERCGARNNRVGILQTNLSLNSAEEKLVPEPVSIGSLGLVAKIDGLEFGFRAIPCKGTSPWKHAAKSGFIDASTEAVEQTRDTSESSWFQNLEIFDDFWNDPVEKPDSGTSR